MESALLAAAHEHHDEEQDEQHEKAQTEGFHLEPASGKVYGAPRPNAPTTLRHYDPTYGAP